MSLVKKSDNSGFSLLELLTVIILLGILGVVALGRFGQTDAFAARGFYYDTLAAVRFAQKLAVSSGCDVRVILTAGSYELRQSSSCTADDFVNPVQNPADRGRNYLNTDMPAGFSLSPGTITFNAEGFSENATADFTLSGGSLSYSFRVYQSTGLVEDRS